MNTPDQTERPADMILRIHAGAEPSSVARSPKEDPYHTDAPSGRADERHLVLKHNDSFAVFNTAGDFDGADGSKLGLYVGGTRHLSLLRVRLNGRRPLLLVGAAARDGTRVIVDLMSPDTPGPAPLKSGEVHVSRAARLWNGVLAHRLTATNYATRSVEVALEVEVSSDFADVFEVRGMQRAQRGQLLAPIVGEDGLTLSYRGLDGVTRWTSVRGSPRPARVWSRGLEFRAVLAPGARAVWHVAAAPERDAAPPAGAYAEIGASLARGRAEDQSSCCQVESDNELMTEWLTRSAADLWALTTRTETGPYLFAGVPWYCCPFGRDGIITALQTLWINPDWARGVLAFLASTQADTTEPARDAEPGKILHEMRGGEMAALGEVPFGRYYGTVDATPLFIVLAGEYHHATGDTEFVRSIWPNVERALEWIDRYGDADGDGFVEYRSDSPAGLRNQGWKDSHDSVLHADGSEPVGPIALCEVQGYVYDAWRHAARLATALDEPDKARALVKKARRLRRQFNESFWDDGLGAYALALDGQKRRCAVLSSNAGQCLLSRIAPPERAAKIARLMMGPKMFSGWGVRTLADDAPRYNPMSYHNGSVWPHDNALIALGASRYGLRRPAARLLDSWLEASIRLEQPRLPELICGFDRARHSGPVLYPVACSPQAWAAGAVFMILRACLGLAVDGKSGVVRITRARLPASVEGLTLRGLRVGGKRADLTLRGRDTGVDVAVLAKDAGVRVIVRS